MVRRPAMEEAILGALARGPVACILGPRQSGKTTLARSVARRRKAAYFDLENPADLARLEQPMLALEPLRGLVVLDEIQRRPELFEPLRVLADRPRKPARFLLLGSASPHMIRGVSESLAGRVRFVDMAGFDLAEVGPGRHRKLWLRGGLPLSFTASSDGESANWRTDFIRTFLERDFPSLGFGIPPPAMRRFWTMVAHFHGQIWNAAEFARSLGTSEPTARRHLDLLTGTFMVRQLQPWHENLAKRQVKAPKIYLRDSGLLHTLLGVKTTNDLLGHPKAGASWEGFAIEQVLRFTGEREGFFWATHAGAELDLLLLLRGKRIGYEMKFMDAPRMTKSMRVALADLHLERLYVVYPGKTSYRLDPKVQAVPITEVPNL